MKILIEQLQYNSPNSTYALRPHAGEERNFSLVCSNEALANALYTELVAHKIEKGFDVEDFNELLEHALGEAKLPVKSCNLALAVYSCSGCFVAQMGNSRVLHIRPIDQEILYDSRRQVLDIYNSKAKVDLITDFKTDDYVLLCSDSNVDEKGVRRVLCNMINDYEGKERELVNFLENVKNRDGIAVVLNRAALVKQSFSLRNINLKAMAMIAAGIVVLGVAFWVVGLSLHSGGGGSEAEVSPDSLVSSQSGIDTSMVMMNVRPDTLSAARKNDTTEAHPVVTPSSQGKVAVDQFVPGPEEVEPVEPETPETEIPAVTQPAED